MITAFIIMWLLWFFFRQAVAQGEKVKAFQKMPVLSVAAPASEIFL